MKVETGTVTIVRINELQGEPHNLDPIRVTLDDIEPGKGRITIECWGKAWASYWGGMGNRTIAQFFRSCNNDYLIQNLTSGQHLDSTRYSVDALVNAVRHTICQRRRGVLTSDALDFGHLSKDEARGLFNESEWALEDCDTPNACWSQSDFLKQIWGSEWWYTAESRAKEPNPEYDYLRRICNAVREALTMLEPTCPHPYPQPSGS